MQQACNFSYKNQHIERSSLVIDNMYNCNTTICHVRGKTVDDQTIKLAMDTVKMTLIKIELNTIFQSLGTLLFFVHNSRAFFTLFLFA